MFGPANSCVTPPFKAYEAVVACELDTANELDRAYDALLLFCEYDALNAWLAKDDVPNKEPVIPCVTFKDPDIT